MTSSLKLPNYQRCQIFKYFKNFIFGVQGRSRSSMLVTSNSSSGMLVMISIKSVRICNSFPLDESLAVK